MRRLALLARRMPSPTGGQQLLSWGSRCRRCALAPRAASCDPCLRFDTNMLVQDHRTALVVLALNTRSRGPWLQLNVTMQLRTCTMSLPVRIVLHWGARMQVRVQGLGEVRFASTWEERGAGIPGGAGRRQEVAGGRRSGSRRLAVQRAR